jgi:hypothetical protein
VGIKNGSYVFLGARWLAENLNRHFADLVGVLVTGRQEIEQFNSRLIARMIELGSLRNSVARHTVRRELNGFGEDQKVNVDTKSECSFEAKIRLIGTVLLGFKVGQ